MRPLFFISTDGVHVGQSDMCAAEVRKLIGPHKILGVSTKSCEEVRRHYFYSFALYKCIIKDILYSQQSSYFLPYKYALLLGLEGTGGRGGLCRYRGCVPHKYKGESSTLSLLI